VTTSKRNPPNAGKGRPKGALNKATREAREFCASIVDDVEYQTTVRRRAIEGTLSPAVECMLWYYAKGKPKESVDVAGATEIILSWKERPT
jgi:hypothetical protein